mmetsp:Transcript_50701/g.108034  ORF Transcript_50701/g.108034 Transcript_50701/m.108034 type:complete len:374 (+) Transcript_50701:38-1159(+)
MEPKILRYPIPGNRHGGLLHIYGDRNSSNIVLYCGGYPDGVEPFAPLARRLAVASGSGSGGDIEEEDSCFVGITCWPGFDYESFRRDKFRSFRREGYGFEEVAGCIREAATRLFAEYDGKLTERDEEPKDPQFTTIFHDFGVVSGMMFVNRSIEEKFFFERKPDRVVLLDVLVGPHPKFDRPKGRVAPYTSRENLVYLAYRGRNAYSFAVSRWISETFGFIVYWILSSLIGMLGLEPTRRIDNVLLAERRMDPYHMVYASYPYYNLFHAMMYDRRALAQATLPLDLTQTPILYIYGADKNVNFHDRRSLEILEREEMEGRSECRVVRVDGAGHWMYCQKPDMCEREIRKFLRSGKHAAGDETLDRIDNLRSKL